MLKRPDQGSRLGKPAGMGFSSVKAPPVLPVSKPPIASATANPTRQAADDDEDMVDLD
jgi:hypothetical protein